MRVSIIFCQGSADEAHANELAGEIRKIKGIEPELVHGSDGVFDVRLDGDLIYSRTHTGKLPALQDLLSYMRDA